MLHLHFTFICLLNTLFGSIYTSPQWTRSETAFRPLRLEERDEALISRTAPFVNWPNYSCKISAAAFFMTRSSMRKDRNCREYSYIKSWIAKAIQDEEQRASDLLWENAPSAQEMAHERLRRIKFLRKKAKIEPAAANVADRLEACEFGNRCRSGACPECSRLFQRWFVRKCRKFIERTFNKLGTELIAITIIPAEPVIRPGELAELSITNFQRRLKYAMKKANIKIAIGGIDFSFNEDKIERYKPFWSVHFYLVTSTDNRARLKGELQRSFRSSISTPRPIKMSSFDNTAYRRSYILKMRFDRRIGVDALKKNGSSVRTCRNTSSDKLRAAERLELLLYLDRIGLASRVIFRNCKPINSAKGTLIK